MSLILYFERNDLSLDEADIDIPFFEPHLNKNINFCEELEGIKTFGFDSLMTYETAPAEVKTYLSVKYNTDKVYNISLCSAEMVFKLLLLREGRIYAPYMAMNHSIISYMSEDIFDIKRAIGVLGAYIKINTIEELLRTKSRTLSSSIKCQSETDFNGYWNSPYKESLRTDFMNDIIFKKKLAGVNIELKVNYVSGIYGYIVGHIGDVLHDLIINVIAEREFIDNNGERYELKYLDFAGCYDDLVSSSDRALLFTDNIFKLLFNDRRQNLIILDNIDAIYSCSEELLKRLATFIKNDHYASFLIFSRQFSNYFSNTDFIRISNLQVTRKGNTLSIEVENGDEDVF